MPNRDLADIRNQYQKSVLDWQDLPDNPMAGLQMWLQEAISAKLYEPTAMTLATVDAQHQPHARVVLLKGVDAGLIFFTNYDSAKGQELAHNHRAAVTLFWPELERQIRVEGEVEPIDEAESNAYFYSRPVDSQLAASISQQSQVIVNREVLETAFTQAKTLAEQEPVDRPARWGGYRLVPSVMEFWQGRPNRLHDRLRWRWQDQGWVKERLAP
jgi:pyridoxamine 5'-phosphate oxidase